MRLKIDENLPVEVAEVLRGAGNDVETVEHEGLAGADDDTILARCLVEGRVLVTLDRGFGSRFLMDSRAARSALIVLRAKSQDIATVQRMARRLAAHVADRNPSGALWILQEDRLRIRRIVSNE